MSSYLERRRQVWYAVMDVPVSAQGHIGKKRLVKSLQTTSRKEADDKKHAVIAEWKALVASAANSSQRPQELAEAEAVVHAREWREKAHLDPEGYQVALEAYVDDLTERVGEDDAQRLAAIVRGKDLRLLDHAEEFLRQLTSVSKTVDIRRNELRQFTEHFIFASEVTSKGLKAWLRALGEEKGLAQGTIKRYLSTANGYWQWLADEEILEAPSAPFAGVTVAKGKTTAVKRSEKAERQAFKREDLVKLVQAASVQDRPLAHLIWLGMWTGARIEELCSLRLEDVKADHFFIRNAKTDAGVRTVPLHRALWPLVAHLREVSEDGYLLSGLTYNKYGDRSNAIGKRFGRLKDKLGFGPEFVFHSVRKSVITEMENLGVPENVTARIHGHKLYTMSYGHYSGGLALEVMAEALAKVDYGMDAAAIDKITRSIT